ncbi:hypothetical protein T10_236 [Trichinella papuae]|uniref:Uncharacterized protein n=1 Tax=Trichinella papuae TaxID=268474 RepID=A0A0V1MSM1_9BILA|nr:hypothetical protein T10_236 [Trichinella papuae]
MSICYDKNNVVSVQISNHCNNTTNSRRSNNDNDDDDDDDTSRDNSVKAYRKSVSKSKREHNMRNMDGDEISIEFFEEGSVSKLSSQK